jgi:hypothetical protein
MSQLDYEILTRAARRALAAPSVFNTQPWRWVVGDQLALYRDGTRQLGAVDPSGRLMLTSCGAALHHARVALAAAGWACDVTRLVTDTSDDLLATVRLTEPTAPSPEQTAVAAAIDLRHTDRRPFADELPDGAMLAIRYAVEAETLRVHRVRWDQMATLRAAAEQAIRTESTHAAYLAELARWTTRDAGSGDGVPADTVVRRVPRRIPTRTLSLDPDAGRPVPADGDRRTSYLILYGRGDAPVDWLRAGEALSAALLTATVQGVAVAPMSDLIEVDAARQLTRSMLAGMGLPLPLSEL